MAFQISPGVNVSEVDLTTVVPSVLTTAGAFAGYFNWGPVNIVKTIDSEDTLVRTFGKPNSNNFTSFFTASSFLAYGNNLKVIRAVGANCFNATANSTGVNTVISNSLVFENLYLHSQNGFINGAYMARYAGYMGNSLTVSTIDAGANFSAWTVNGVNVSGYFNGAPGTSTQAAAAGAANDEIHVIVVDTEGMFTGVKNTVLEVHPYLSKGVDATDSLGNSSYYKNYIFNNSQYIYAVDPVDYANTYTSWGRPLANTSYTTVATSQTVRLTKGRDEAPATANTVSAYNLFTHDGIDISLVLTGDANITVQQYVIDNVAEVRKDCVAFVSPPSANVVNQNNLEASNILAWNNVLARSSSYAVADSGWKYMFDKYNNTYRYIPLNGDIAGLCVNTDNVRDPWFSPAGLNRGQIKNAVRLAWNPNKTERDTLYAKGINPVVSFAGQGIVLYGDKTLQSKPSAFDRINVRRLFIVLEKAIATAAKFSLFEFNDEFTRAQFVALVTPFLRDIQGRRGIYDYRVVCDSSNNTDQVISSNQFVGDIYVKPARSINFIQLNFVAVRTGVDFTEVVGKF
jgi:hypothetical protein